MSKYERIVAAKKMMENICEDENFIDTIVYAGSGLVPIQEVADMLNYWLRQTYDPSWGITLRIAFWSVVMTGHFDEWRGFNMPKTVDAMREYKRIAKLFRKHKDLNVTIWGPCIVGDEECLYPYAYEVNISKGTWQWK